MPATVIKTKAGKHMPSIAAIEPAVPHKRSPARIDILVALRPGSVLLIDVSSRNSTSSNHFFFPTSAERKYATTPPPKLVAPICKNVRKTSSKPARLRSGAAACGAGAGIAASLMGLRRISLEAINETGFRSAEHQPALRHELQFDEQFLDALLDQFVHGVGRIKARLIREFAAHHRVVAERTPQRNVRFGHDALAEIERAEIHQHFLD